MYWFSMKTFNKDTNDQSSFKITIFYPTPNYGSFNAPH